MSIDPITSNEGFILYFLPNETMTEKKGTDDKDPLHAITLENMLEDLVKYFSFPYLADKV